MKRILLAIPLIVLVGIGFSKSASAFDWSQAESGRDNIRLYGFNSQPGYVRFEDGDTAHSGKLFAHYGSLYWYYGTTETSDLVTACNAGNCGKVSLE